MGAGLCRRAVPTSSILNPKPLAMKTAQDLNATHAFLKKHTRPQHLALERTPLLQRLISTRATRSDYLTTLIAFYGFYEPLEARLRRHAGWCAGQWDADVHLEKTRLLRRDLHSLGYTDAALEPLPRCTHLPDCASWCEVLGVLYVLEGSALGGRVILAHLNKVVPAFDELPQRFYSGDTSDITDTVARWQRFLEQMNHCVSDELEREQVGRGALGTFDNLRQWLQAYPPSAETQPQIAPRHDPAAQA